MSSRFKFLFVLVFLAGHSQHALANSDYCYSRGHSTYYEWVESITINGEDYVSPQNYGYFDHTDRPAILQPGENEIVLTPGYRGYAYPEQWRGWLDLNGDNNYDSDEIIFESSGNSERVIQFTLPESIETITTGMRIAMQYGAYPEPCGTYYYGETEDFAVSIENTPVVNDYSHHLTLDYSFELSRTGQLGDPVIWVVEKDGEIVLRRNAAGELRYRYYRNFDGDNIRVWLEQFIDGSYQQVSNIVEYTPGVTDLYELTLSDNFELGRTGQLGDSVQWVIEKDGEIVLQRNAANELNYTYFNNTTGSDFRVWLQMFLDGQYQVVSNTVEYTPDIDQFELSMGNTFELNRTGHVGDPVQWVIEKDGEIVLQRNAADELNYTYFNNTAGSEFRVWLQMFVDGQYQVVSNIVEYTVPASYPYTLSLSNYTVSRSGNLGDNVSWVIIKNGAVVLQRNASNELSYTYFSNTSGSTIAIYLHQWIDGYYQPVSNTLTYTVP